MERREKSKKKTHVSTRRNRSMGFGTCLLGLVILGGALAVILPFAFPDAFSGVLTEIPPMEDGWWGRGKPPSDGKGKDDERIRNFKVKVEDSVLDDLRDRLNRTRYVEPLENVNFEYGFHPAELKKIVDYWKDDYDWRKQEKRLNSYDQYLTQIEGIDIHFIRAKPSKKALSGNQALSVPLLMIHGWPGSVLEFYKILPLLTEGNGVKGVPIEVICPSIPGYGFSEDPHQPGFSAVDAARIFDKLMLRLGYKEYYVQGGDWGSLIARLMASFYPERIRGLMLNCVATTRFSGVMPTLKFFMGLLAPSWIFEPEDAKYLIPFGEKLGLLLRETGYLHIQATKPDTVGAALTDSPAGLAAYILEKFSTWTHKDNIHQPDGGLTKKFDLDELLTNVMIYWINDKSASSMRFYKETIAGNKSGTKLDPHELGRLIVKVPTGVALFPEEFYNTPLALSSHIFVNIVRVAYLPQGGHFAAFEEPQILAHEIFASISEIEKIKASAEKAQKH